MKILTNCILLAFLGIFTACEKTIPVIENPEPGTLVHFKPIEWVLTPASSVEDTGYYSIQGYYGPGIYQYTRIIQMRVNGLVTMDGQPVKFSGDFYLRQIAGSKSSTLGYLNLCEARDDQTKHCLEMVLINKIPLDIKFLSDLKRTQTFQFSARVDANSGKYDKAENNSREFELKLTVDPHTSSYSLNLIGSLLY